VRSLARRAFCTAPRAQLSALPQDRTDAVNVSGQHSLLPAVQKRTFLVTKIAGIHGCKRETAAPATMIQCIAPPPRQGSATPGCERPQPALDPAPGLPGRRTSEHFPCPKKAHRHLVADLDRRSQPRLLAFSSLFVSSISIAPHRVDLADEANKDENLFHADLPVGHVVPPNKGNHTENPPLTTAKSFRRLKSHKTSIVTWQKNTRQKPGV